MATDLSDYVEVLRREVTPPGGAQFADVDDDVFTGYLADAVWEARLDGFLEGWEASEDGEIPEVNGKEFPREHVALLVLYAGIRILRLRILNTNTRFSAKAGPAEYSQEQSANALTEMLKNLNAIKDRLVDQAQAGETCTYLVDGFSVRSWAPSSYYGSHFADVLSGIN
jgi:hypothetical protein